MFRVDNRCDSAFRKHVPVETCSVAYRGQVEYALATSDILDDFLKKSEECTQAADEHACLEVSLEATSNKEDPENERAIDKGEVFSVT